MEAVNGVSDGDKGGPPPPSPLTGCYLLIVIGEPHCNEHKDIILQRVAKGLLSWDVNDCLVDLEKELAIITEQALEGEEARYGERLIQFASENLVTEILIHPVVSTLAQCVRNLLSSFTRHRHIIHAGYTFANNGSWILQDGTFSSTDFSEAFQEIEVLRVIRAYENGISLDLHCAPEGDWTRLPKEPFSKGCKVHVNSNDVLTAGSPSITSFINYLEPFLVPAELENILESSDVVGNIRFSRPTLYVFPGGQGDAALFGINGFNMLLDGGFSRKACFWDFVRHLDRLDAVLLTRLNNSNVNGISAVLRRKRQNALYPQIGHFFCNIQERKAILSPDGDKDKDPLLITLLDEGQEIVSNLRQLSLTPQVCYRDSEPINLYHKVGHGTLDMYVLSPAKDSKEVREFLQKWNNNDQKMFANQRSNKEFVFPLQNLVSICALLVWQPANPEDTITRILFPGSSPQTKIFEGLEKIKSLEFIKHPVCSEKSLAPTNIIKTKQSVLDRILQTEKKIPLDNKKEKPQKPPTDNIIDTEMKNGEVNGIQPIEKGAPVKKSDSTESEKSISKPKKIIENGEKTDKFKPKPKTDPRPKPRSESQQRKVKTAEKKPSPTTPKKQVEKMNGEPPKTKPKPSPTATPAKSAKEATNRKVVESKIKAAPKKEPPKPAAEKKEVKTERKPISRRPKDISKLSGSPSKKVNGVQKPDSISRRGKLDKEGTTDSSTVSTPSADQDSILKKDISKLTTDEIQNLKAQELADLKEEQEAVKEIEAVFRKGELHPDKPSDFRKIKDLSIDDKLESEEYLIIEKTEIEQDVVNEANKEEETQKIARDSEESEKKRQLSEEKEEIEEKRMEIQDEVQKIITSATDIVKGKDEVVDASKEISAASPEDKIDVSTDKKDNEEIKEVAQESQPDEKGSANIESGATTTAPTLPEDERMPLDEIKEDNGGKMIEEKHVKEDTKEKDVPVIQLPPKTFENVAKLPQVVGIRLDKQTHIRDIVKTPDEVADLPVHEEVEFDHFDEYPSGTETKSEPEEVKKDDIGKEDAKEQVMVAKEEKKEEPKEIDDKEEVKDEKKVDDHEDKLEQDKVDEVEDKAKSGIDPKEEDKAETTTEKKELAEELVEKDVKTVISKDLNKKELSKSPDEEKDTDEHELEQKKEEISDIKVPIKIEVVEEEKTDAEKREPIKTKEEIKEIPKVVESKGSEKTQEEQAIETKDVEVKKDLPVEKKEDTIAEPDKRKESLTQDQPKSEEVIEKSETEVKEKDDLKLKDSKEDEKLDILKQELPEVSKDEIIVEKLSEKTDEPTEELKLKEDVKAIKKLDEKLQKLKDEAAIIVETDVKKVELVATPPEKEETELKEDVSTMGKINEKLQKLKDEVQDEHIKAVSEVVTHKVEEAQHAEPVIITTDSLPDSPETEERKIEDKMMELGRKSPKEREEDVAIIVASVAVVLKSDAPLEEFEGKIPFNIPYKSYTTELRETHITTVESPVSDENKTVKAPEEPIDPKASSTYMIEEERKIAPIHEEPEVQESKISKMIKDSNELMQATSRIIQDIKQTQPKTDTIIEEPGKEEQDGEAATVHRMLVTASSEDGGEETEICPPGTITFSRSSESSGRSSPDLQSQKLSQKSSIADTVSDATVITKSLAKELQSSLEEVTKGIDESQKRSKEEDIKDSQTVISETISDTEKLTEDADTHDKDVDKKDISKPEKTIEKKETADISTKDKAEADSIKHAEKEAPSETEQKTDDSKDVKESIGKTEIPLDLSTKDVIEDITKDKELEAEQKAEDPNKLAESAEVQVEVKEDTVLSKTDKPSVPKPLTIEEIEKVPEDDKVEAEKQKSEAPTAEKSEKTTTVDDVTTIAKDIIEDKPKTVDTTKEVAVKTEEKEHIKAEKEEVITNLSEEAKSFIDEIEKLEASIQLEHAALKVDDVPKQVADKDAKPVDKIYLKEIVRGEKEKVEDGGKKEVVDEELKELDTAKTSDETEEDKEKASAIEFKETITKEVDAALETIKETVEKAEDKAEIKVETVVKKVEEQSSFLGGLVNDIGACLETETSKLIEDAQKQIQDIRDKSKSTVEDIKEDLSTKKDTFVKEAVEGVSSTIDTVKEEVHEVKETVTEEKEKLVEKAKTLEESVVKDADAVTSKLKSELEESKEIIEEKVKDVKETLVEQKETVTGVIADVKESVTKDVETKLEEAKKEVIDTKDKTKTEIEEVCKLATSKVDEKIVNLTKKIDEASDETKQTIDDSKKVLEEVKEKVIEETSTAVKHIERKTDTILEEIETKEDSLKKSVVEETKQAEDKFLERKEEVVEKLENLSADLTKTGTDLKDAVKSEISEIPFVKKAVDSSEAVKDSEKDKDTKYDLFNGLESVEKMVVDVLTADRQGVEDKSADQKDQPSTIDKIESDVESIVDKGVAEVKEFVEETKEAITSLFRRDSKKEEILEKTAHDIEENFEIVSDMTKSVVFEKCDKAADVDHSKLEKKLEESVQSLQEEYEAVAEMSKSIVFEKCEKPETEEVKEEKFLEKSARDIEENYNIVSEMTQSVVFDKCEKRESEEVKEEKFLEKSARDIEENYKVVSEMAQSVVFDKCEKPESEKVKEENFLEKSARDIEENYKVVSEMAQSVVFDKCEKPESEEVKEEKFLEKSARDIEENYKLVSEMAESVVFDKCEVSKEELKEKTELLPKTVESSLPESKLPSTHAKDIEKKHDKSEDFGSTQTVEQKSEKMPTSSTVEHTTPSVSVESKDDKKENPAKSSEKLETRDIQMSGKSSPALSSDVKDLAKEGSGKSTPDIKEIDHIKVDNQDSLLSGKSSPGLSGKSSPMLSGRSSPGGKAESKDSLLSGKSSPEHTKPDSKASSLSGKSSPALSGDLKVDDKEKVETLAIETKDIQSPKSSPGGSGKSSPALTTETGKTEKSSPSPDLPKEQTEKDYLIGVTEQDKETDHKETEKLPSGKTSPVQVASQLEKTQEPKKDQESEKDKYHEKDTKTEKLVTEAVIAKDEKPEVDKKSDKEDLKETEHESKVISVKDPNIPAETTSVIPEKKTETEKDEAQTEILQIKSTEKKLSISDVEIFEDEKVAEKYTSDLSKTESPEDVKQMDDKTETKDVDSIDSGIETELDSKVKKAEELEKTVASVEQVTKDPPLKTLEIKKESIAGSSATPHDTSLSPAKTSTEDLHLSGKSTPDIAEVEKLKAMQGNLEDEKHILGSSTPPTVPVSPIVKEISTTQVEDVKTTFSTPIKSSTITSIKDSDIRSCTPGSDDYEIGASTHSDISSGQVSRAPHLLESERIESDDDDDVPGSPMSVTSQVAHSRSSSRYDFEDDRIGTKMDPMNTSFYGALPDEEETELDFEKAMVEHRQTRGEDLVVPAEDSPSYLYEITKAKYSSKTPEPEALSGQTQLDQINKNGTSNVMTASFIGDLPSSATDTKKDVLDSWGKPLGLPSPAPPNDNRGTPKKERKLPSNVSAKNKLNDDKKRSDSPSKYRNKKFNPVYVDLTYVPHHGNAYYSYVDFFKRVRARYYVFSGIEPSREVYNALLEAKQTWEDKELEVTIIPTYDTDILGYWVAENEELLTKYKIDLSPSASRCTINLQDHETSCSAYRLEF